MMIWRLKDLMARYGEKTGKPLLPRHLALGTGLANSTTYQLVEGNPKRVSFDTAEALLTFLSKELGPLDTNDLLEFVPDSEMV